MKNKNDLCTAEGDAVGIVVQDRPLKESRPRAVAFVWGRKVNPAPTLPYGRWKQEVRPAA
ncbi:MAG TPA: hypothetical protein VFI91_10990 [Longimicrobiaceae bacterium]|nr:hypothetical protein [Longimicrobiaceae bacterium]